MGVFAGFCSFAGAGVSTTSRCPVNTDASLTWMSPGKSSPPNASSTAVAALLTGAACLAEEDPDFALTDWTLKLNFTEVPGVRPFSPAPP